ncbi:carbohydrate binding family 9 domain-containing protein [Pseudoalteromonas spongiae]|uniref:DUF5916 domain-containing protein n=1 Tax=Pseudoalteromonas spongiae TaxID=298657 RepID=A0ABU8ERR0_9GAMM
MKYPLALCAALLSTPAIAKTDTTLEIPFLSDSVVIDGNINESVWQQAKRIEINNITWPYENMPAKEQAYALVYEDGESLNVAYVVSDSNPNAIRAFYRDRDKNWSDDLVGLKIDSYNNEKLAYQFFINPLGVQMDSIENVLTGQESDAWDGIWHSSGQLTETGYVVEISIPFRILNFEQGNNSKKMAMEFVRFLPRNERLRISSIKIDHANSCWVCQMQTVSGFEQAEQGNNLTLVPTIVAGRSESRDVSVAPIEDWQADNTLEPGLDLKWGITPEVTLTATINPDFSQVEADVAQLGINNSFTLFFPEKRAFFLENTDYFSTPWNLIYTRNVAEPDAGVKLTGSVGSHTFGSFIANDNQSNVIIPGNLGSTVVSLESKSNNVAARYRYDFTNDFSIAATTTARSADDYYNYVSSLDSKYRLTENDTFIAQLAMSRTKYSDEFRDSICDADNLSTCKQQARIQCENEQDCQISEQYLRVSAEEAIDDIAYKFSYEHNEKYWSLFARYDNLGEDFRGDLGFMNQVDFNKFVSGGRYRWYGEQGVNWYNRIEFYSDWDISHNANGELLEKEVQADLSFNGPLQSYGKIELLQRDRVGLRHNKARLDIDGNTTLFNENLVGVYLEFKPISGMFASLYANTGNHIDLANNRLGDKTRIRPVLNMNLNRHIELRLRHTYEAMDVDGTDLFTANLTDARLSYQFNNRSFVRLAVIYRDIERNPNNYIDDVTAHYKGFSTQLLYSYKVNPQTVFFAGYSDNGYQDDDLSKIEKTDRSVFMKMSYAWML